MTGPVHGHPWRFTGRAGESAMTVVTPELDDDQSSRPASGPGFEPVAKRRRVGGSACSGLAPPQLSVSQRVGVPSRRGQRKPSRPREAEIKRVACCWRSYGPRCIVWGQ
jgi:hypothetical protein